MTNSTTTEPVLDAEEELDRVTEATGLPRETVARILQAQMDLLFALGIAHGNAEDAERGATLRAKYPDILRDSAGMGRSREKLVTFEIEATIAQLESGASSRDVVEVLAASDEMRMSGDGAEELYRSWAKGWIK